MKTETDKRLKGWKTCAIILLAVCVLETGLIGYYVISVNIEIHNTKVCYYDFCADYPEATFEESVCTCYDYSILGDNFVVAKEKYFR